jgi:hypothetical protein
MTQGAPRDGIIDIDAMLIQRSTDPVIIRLGGREWLIRRDLTAEEVVNFWKLSDSNESVAAWALLTGDDESAQDLHATITPLPAEIFVNVSRQIIRAAGLSITGTDLESAGGSGNSKAS